jgi:hypothetical protein
MMTNSPTLGLSAKGGRAEAHDLTADKCYAGELQRVMGWVDGARAKGHQVNWRELDAEATPAAPALTVPAAPHLIPPPADFCEREQLGAIDGQPVFGEQSWDEIDGCAKRWDVKVELGGLDLSCDGEYLSIDQGEPGTPKRWPIWAIGRIVELQQAGHLDQLLRIARAWLNDAA